MTTTNELLAQVNKDLKYYEIVMVDRCVGEDGQYFKATGEQEFVGYGLRNITTGILEHTSTMLPGVLWQATHFESTLKSMLAGEDRIPQLAAVEDIIPPTVQ